MISEATREKIDAEIAKYPKARGALLPALHLVQAEHGFVSAESARELAAIFEIEPVDVMEVVSFYNMFHTKTVGRREHRVCTRMPCVLRGADDKIDPKKQNLHNCT